LEVVEKELKANIFALNSESGLLPKKKRKQNEDKNKAVHVLVDALISLLTKFLETSLIKLLWPLFKLYG
jgi:hypothetical protein